MRFLLDMDMGSLCVGVNGAPLVTAFSGIDQGATWGAFPCVASCGNNKDVRVRVHGLRSSTTTNNNSNNNNNSNKQNVSAERSYLPKRPGRGRSNGS